MSELFPFPKERPPDHATRMARARLSLDGLSVGDAFGEKFFTDELIAESRINLRELPPAPWGYTDDTEMALAIVDILERRGGIDREDLAAAFARRYIRDPRRGYGGTAHGILRDIAAGMSWQRVSRAVFGGDGSMGNGGAMRVAPVGAYFADDLDAVVRHARASAEVTHAHLEGQAGAIAVAVAAAWAWGVQRNPEQRSGGRMLETIMQRTPESTTRDGLARALDLLTDGSVLMAVHVLGNGSRITAPDTVPFALWCAARHLDSFVDALWTPVSGFGDRDTTCAIVGGIVALSAGPDAIPQAWLAAREPLH